MKGGNFIQQNEIISEQFKLKFAFGDAVDDDDDETHL